MARWGSMVVKLNIVSERPEIKIQGNATAGRTDRLTGNSLCFRKFYISNQTLEYLNIPLTNFRASICQAI